MKQLKRLAARMTPRRRRYRQHKKMVRAAARAEMLPFHYILWLRERSRAKEERRRGRRDEARRLHTRMDAYIGLKRVPLSPAQMFNLEAV